jgi:aldose sugar dehydrogenase
MRDSAPPRNQWRLLALAAVGLASAAQSEPAARLYAANCAACHGAQLQGTQGPALIPKDGQPAFAADELARIIKEGRVEAGMPAWGDKLSADDIGSLVQFIGDRINDNSTERLQQLDRQEIAAYRRGILRTEVASFRLERVAELGKPQGLAALPDGRLLVAEERGALRIIQRDGVLLLQPVKGTPAGKPKDVFHRALLAVALDPRYSQNGWIYLTCGDTVMNAVGKEVTEMTLVRGRLKGDSWVDSTVLVHIPTNSTVSGPIAFDGNGHVFTTTASAAGLGTGPDSKVAGNEPFPAADLQARAPQDPKDPAGKILRYNVDGTIPSDNPYVTTPGAFAPIWSLGVRNAEGLAFDPATNQLWATDHGPRGGDELNLVLRGHNYGWPVISYGTRYDGIGFTREVERAGMDQPVVNWTPDIGISAVTVYRGNAFPKWRGNLLVGSLVTRQLLRIVLQKGHAVLQELVVQDLGRIRAIAIDPRGFIYIALELRLGGAIVRLVPSR